MPFEDPAWTKPPRVEPVCWLCQKWIHPTEPYRYNPHTGQFEHLDPEQCDKLGEQEE